MSRNISWSLLVFFLTTIRTLGVRFKVRVGGPSEFSVLLYELHGYDLMDAYAGYDQNFQVQGGHGNSGPEHFSSLSFQICTYSTCPYSC
jgi:hypothetical protein